jgi:manganese/iron transport system permease protein
VPFVDPVINTLTDGYARRALVEIVIVAVLCGTVGVHVVNRRLAFPTMAMTHATFPGVVLAGIAGVNLVLGAGLFGVLVVLAIGLRPGAGGSASRRADRDVSNATGVVLAAGFALGVGLLSAQDGFSQDLTAYLVGSVLTVTRTDIAVSLGATAAAMLVLAALRKELLLVGFDRSGAAAAGYPVRALDIALLALIEVTIVTSMPAVGVILSVAFVVGPAASARLWCSTTGSMTATAIGVAVACGMIGLWISERWNVAAGGAIVLTVGAVFALSVVLAPPVRSRRGRSQAVPARG